MEEVLTILKWKSSTEMLILLVSLFLRQKKIEASEQRNCWITYTSQQTHDILKNRFRQKPDVYRPY